MATQVPHFDGETYQPSLDFQRLSKQLFEVKYLLLMGGWHTLAEIRAHVEKRLEKPVSEAGVSARLRDLRKKKFGGYQVERRREGNCFEYRIAE